MCLCVSESFWSFSSRDYLWGLTVEKNVTNFWQSMGLTFGNQWD